MKMAMYDLQVNINVALNRPIQSLSLGIPLGRTGNYFDSMIHVASVLEPAAQEELLARKSKWTI
jgi:hypothetical protein